MKTVPITQRDRAQLDKLMEIYPIEDESLRSGLFLLFTNDQLSLKAIVLGGYSYLPKIRKSDGTIDLELLEGFIPKAVSYYIILSEIDCFSEDFRNLCLDLAVYANGESVQIDSFYANYNPTLEISKVVE